MTTFTGYIARETEKAYGILVNLTDEKLAWIPKKKIESETRAELGGGHYLQISGQAAKKSLTPSNRAIYGCD